jgi:hypothetical protein
MRPIFFFLFFASALANAQNFVVTDSKQPTCFGDCTGTITFTTSAVNGPFTVAVSNPSSCPNSTVSSSTVNSVTVTNICSCPGTYTFSIYTGSVLAGTMVYQFPMYATQPFNLATNSIVPASCASCCDGQVYVVPTGGNLSTPPSYSINGVATPSVSPATSLCVGNYTVCATDASGCLNCKLFGIGNAFGFNEYALSAQTHLSPNPASREIFAETDAPEPIGAAVIWDVTGRKVAGPNFVPQQKVTVSLGDLSPGIYYLFLYSQKGALLGYQKFVKKDG